MRVPAWILTAALAGALAAFCVLTRPVSAGHNPSPLSAAQGGTGLNAAPSNGVLPIGTSAGFVLAGLQGTTGIFGVTNTSGVVTLGSSVADSAGLGSSFLIRTTFTALGTGASVTIYSSNAPYAMNICDTWIQVTTVGGSSAMSLQDGSGNVLSPAESFSGTGVFRPGTLGHNANSVAAGGSIKWQRTVGSTSLTGVGYARVQRQ